MWSYASLCICVPRAIICNASSYMSYSRLKENHPSLPTTWSRFNQPIYFNDDIFNWALFTLYFIISKKKVNKFLFEWKLKYFHIFKSKKDTNGGSIWLSSKSVLRFSSKRSAVRCSTIDSRLLAYFSSFCSTWSTMSSFLCFINQTKIFEINLQRKVLFNKMILS